MSTIAYSIRYFKFLKNPADLSCRSIRFFLPLDCISRVENREQPLKFRQRRFMCQYLAAGPWPLAASPGR